MDEKLTLKKKQQLVKDLLEQKIARSNKNAKVSGNSKDFWPLSFPMSLAQQGMWVNYQVQPDDTSSHVAAAYMINGQVDIELLSEALDKVVSCHQMLQVRVVADNVEGAFELKDKIDHSSRFELNHCDQKQWANIDTAANLFTKRAFDLVVGNTWRAGLFMSPANNMNLVVLAFHHIIIDGLSIAKVLSELLTTYISIQSGLQGPKILSRPYSQYVDDEKAFIDSSFGKQAQTYWQDKLGGQLPVLDIPNDSDHIHSSKVGGALPLAISTALRQQLLDYARTEKVTVYSILFTAFSILLSRFAGQREVLIGVPVALKDTPDLEATVGYLVNILPVRVSVDPALSFAMSVRQANALLDEALTYKRYPYQRMISDLNSDSGRSNSSLCEAVFNLVHRKTTLSDMKVGGLSVEVYDVDHGVGQFKLNFELVDSTDSFSGYIKYRVCGFSEHVVKRLEKNYLYLIHNLIGAPEQSISSIVKTEPVERELVETQWSDARDQLRFESLDKETINDLLDVHYENNSDRTALVDGEISLSYCELQNSVHSLACSLIEQGCRKGDTVALFFDNTWQMFVALLAVLKCGCHYIPLHYQDPHERRRKLLSRANPTAILIAKTDVDIFEGLFEDRLVVFERSVDDNVAANECAFPHIDRQELAYILFTSGSTGEPKGVQISHANVIGLIQGFQKQAPIAESMNTMMIAPLSFDASVWEVFGTLCFGGTLRVAPQDAHYNPQSFVNAVYGWQLNNMWIPPGILTEVSEVFANDARNFDFVKRVVVGASPISQSVLLTLQESLPCATIVNVYGPTEATVFTAVFVFNGLHGRGQRTPIGKPLPGYRVDIVDCSMQPVPVGVNGEIIISGNGVGHGYFDAGGHEVSGFITHPNLGVPAYRTGDIARWLGDGNIEFAGRMDKQVKILGVRIETEEVEETIRRHADIKEVAVCTHTLAGKAQYLLAFVVFANGNNDSTEPQELSVKQHIDSTLPPHMRPARVVVVEEIPLFNSGKIDTQKLIDELQIDDLQEEQTKDIVPPETEIETRVLEIWKNHFQRDDFGIEADFFLLGGNSILALRLVSDIQNCFQISVSVQQFFNNATVESVAKVVEKATSRELEDSIAPVPRENFNRPQS